jgi:hypothetical protein
MDSVRWYKAGHQLVIRAAGRSGKTALTKEDDVNASTLKLVEQLLPVLLGSIIGIVDYHLTALSREEIPDLILYAFFDLVS